MSLDESRVEIVRGWVTAQQAVQVEAASRRAGSCWLERPVREVIRGEVERLERVVDDTLCRALMSIPRNRETSVQIFHGTLVPATVAQEDNIPPPRGRWLSRLRNDAS